MALTVTIYASVDDTEPMEIEGIDYVSYVAPTTYGPPALIAPARGKEDARAQVGDKVLYINTGRQGPPMWEIERTSD
jgi:hypothetical protein